MIVCVRKIEFDSAHRLINHEGKCRMFHGHRYVIEASFTAKKLDELEERDNCFDTRIGTFVLKSMIASFFLKYPTKE